MHSRLTSSRRGLCLCGAAILLAWLPMAPGFAQETPAFELATVVTEPDFWDLSPDAFLANLLPAGFRFTSAQRQEARSARPGLACFGLPAYEMLVGFRDQRPVRVVASVYNRGDAGPLPVQELEALAALLETRISEHTGRRPKTSRIRLRGGDVKKHVSSWFAQPLQYLLEWSATELDRRTERAEYITVTITIGAVSETRSRAAMFRPNPVSRSALRARVTRDENGGRYLRGIPMVDQGAKGYCACAVVERVLRYYGRDIDQHEIAQISGTAAFQGTSVVLLEEALKAISSTLRIRMRALEPVLSTPRDLRSLLRNYNRLARRQDAAEVDWNPDGIPGLAGFLLQLDPELLVRSRGEGLALRRFEREVRRHTDRGIPLLWSVVLGIVPEPNLPRQARGGHMRLIIGYHPEESEVFYTDTWGAGHERKRMDSRSALAITTRLDVLEPR